MELRLTQPAHQPVLTVASLIEANGIKFAGRPAICAAGRTPLTWGELASGVARHRAVLQAAGINRAHRVALALPDGPDMAVAFLSVASTAAAAPLRQTLKAAEAKQDLTALRADLLIVDDNSPGAHAQAARESGVPVIRLRRRSAAPAGSFDLLPQPEPGPAQGGLPGPDDIALVIKTSGTTGRPKVTPLSNRAFVLAAIANADAMGISPTDRGLIILPMNHISALGAELIPYLAYGGSATWPDLPLTEDTIIEGLRDPGVTTMMASPFYYEAVVRRLELAHDRLNSPSLRFLRSSSSGLTSALHARIEAATAVPVVEAYGATEAGPIAMNPLPPGVRKPGTVGRPLSLEVAIMSDEWLPLPPDRTGEIAVKGPTVFAGYDSAEDTAAKFRDGWLRTGDAGYFDPDGYLHIVGRVDELINRGGEKIDPAYVESALLACEGVAEAAAFGLPDAKYGQEVYAAVVLKPGAAQPPDSLRAEARRSLGQAAPRQVFIAGALPKTDTGKVRRRELARMYGPAARK